MQICEKIKLLKMNIKSKICFIIFCVLLLTCFQSLAQKQDNFKVVLDAGHGGTGKGGDPGAVKNGIKEKDIVLAVTLKIGKLLEKYKDIDVAYTRKTDVFIPLDQRPKFANKEKANIFVSIHCNSVDNPRPFGTETYVLGVARDKHSLEVAKRENSVIFLEEDYQEKYQGYDPNNPESVVGLMLLQGEYKNQSILLASAIQQDFTNRLKRNNRGVKEAGYLVLRDCAMPAILVELGFISNKEEAVYLNSEKGQNELANSIANAIISYKNEHYSYSEPFEYIAIKQEEAPVDTGKAVFKVQISASGTSLETKPQNFKGLDAVSKMKDGSLYKYYYGETNDYKTAQNLLIQAKDKGYKDAYIVAFKDGKQVKVSDVIN